MTMLERIKKDFSYNEPIIQKELDYPELSKPAIRNALKRLVDQGKLKRYDNGIYFLPKKTRLGPSVISSNEVVTYKYITDGNETYGYFKGLKLLNELGLTTQVPNTYEVRTNKAKTKSRTTQLGKFNIVVTKSNVEVTNENVGLLKLIELVNYEQFTSLSEAEKIQVMSKIGVTRDNIKLLDNLVDLYPDRISKNLIKSGVYRVIA